MTKSDSPLRKKPLHVPGQSIDDAINQMWDDRGLLYFAGITLYPALAVYEWMRYLTHEPPHPMMATILAAVVSAYSIVGLLKLRRKTQQLRLGRDAERIVAEALDPLREEGCRIFHDIVADGFNVDHVVLSRGGVFVVETKAVGKPRGWKGQPRIKVDGGRIRAAGADLGPRPLEQAMGEARWVRDILKRSTKKKLPVKACVVFPGWFVEPMPKDEREVWVLSPEGLAGFIRNEPPHMPEEDLHLAASHLSLYIRSPWAADDSRFAKRLLKEQAKAGT
jgi:hypothetical protein